MTTFKRVRTLLLALTAGLLVACSGDGDGSSNLSGEVRMDGSSTVYPLSEAVAEEFLIAHPRVRVTVGVSGTGGGFSKFIAGEIDINNASREIVEFEIEQAANNAIDYLEIPVAFDGLSVVVNQTNDWVDHLTVEELSRIWQPGSDVERWSDVRPEWPAQPIRLYGPGTASGTFDYFTEAVNGRSGAARADYTSSEDDNVVVQGVSGDEYALGFFGYAYYYANRSRLKIVPIDNGDGPVSPTPETIESGEYAPLSRPIFIYLNPASLERPAVREFVEFYVGNAGSLAEEVGYITMPRSEYQESLDIIENL